MAEPTGSRNITQSLFNLDEKLMKQQKSNALQTISPFSWNAQSAEQGMDGSQYPAYINQARLASYYQDNPWATLDFSNQFGLNAMGGPVRGYLGPGSRPGNTIKNVPKPGFALYNNENGLGTYSPINEPGPVNNIVPKNVNGIFVPNFMVNFGQGYMPL